MIRKLFKYPVVMPLLLIGFAACLRVILEIQGWMPTNGDESIMNLAALHIAYHGEMPVFFYGQYYLGAFEAYIGAVLFRLFGPSVLIIRLEMIGFYTAFLVVLYNLVKRLYNRNFALVILGISVLGSPRVFELQMGAIGYPELPLLSALPFLVAYMLVSNDDQSWQRNAMLYTAWGFTAGFALWVHVLAAPYVLTSGSLLILWRFRDMLRMGIWTILLGFLIGASPLLWYNVHADPGKDTLTAVLYMTDLGQKSVYNFWEHAFNTLFISVPATTGLSSQCFISAIAGSYPFLPTYHLHCLAEQSLWGLGCVVLALIALVMAVVGLQRRTSRDRSEMILQSTRLLLIVAAAITVVLYIRGGAPVLQAFGGSRYLICLWVSLPVLLYPLWLLKRQEIHHKFDARLFAFTPIFLALVYGTVMTFHQIPQSQAENKQIAVLASYLEKHHIMRFYSEYWTCNRLIFFSQEKLICGNTDVTPHNRLVHGMDRYQPYHEAIVTAKNPAFVYPSTNITIGVVEYYLKKNGISYTVNELAGCTIIVPNGSILS